MRFRQAFLERPHLFLRKRAELLIEGLHFSRTSSLAVASHGGSECGIAKIAGMAARISVYFLKPEKIS
jgi:hypothetical protein